MDVFSDMSNVHFDALKDKLNDDNLKEWEKIIESIKSDSAGDFWSRIYMMWWE